MYQIVKKPPRRSYNEALQKENIHLRKSSSLFLYNEEAEESRVIDSTFAQQYDYIPREDGYIPPTTIYW